MDWSQLDWGQQFLVVLFVALYVVPVFMVMADIVVAIWGDIRRGNSIMLGMLVLGIILAFMPVWNLLSTLLVVLPKFLAWMTHRLNRVVIYRGRR